MEKSIVMYPGLAVSHFVPMLQLADALLDEGYAVKVALIDPSLKGDIAFAAVVGRVVASFKSKPSVAFHTLPRIPNPPAIAHDARFLASYFDLVSRHNQHLHDFLCSLPPGSVRALIVDVMSFEALDVTRKLGIPAYTFFASNASALATSVQVSLGRAAAEGQPSFREMGDAPLNLHGVPPVPASHLFAEMLDNPESEAYKSMVYMSRGILEPNGILVNTFVSLEAPEEVEAKVKLVLESEEGDRLRERVNKHREAAAMAWKDGGSSRAAFSRFLSDAGNINLGPARS
ncbi:hypothetical protein EJB05_36719, partial [Eragrostis curvula]